MLCEFLVFSLRLCRTIKKSRRYESIADASGNTKMIGLWLNISSSEIIGNWFWLYVAAVRLGMVPSTFDREKYLQETEENSPNMNDRKQYANRKIIIDCWFVEEPLHSWLYLENPRRMTECCRPKFKSIAVSHDPWPKEYGKITI